MSDQVALDEDRAFERLLLGAGHAEALPQERTEAALIRFSASVAALQGGALATAALTAKGAGTTSWARCWAIAKWLGLGAIVGGVATFAWLQRDPVQAASRAPARALAPLVGERTEAAQTTPPQQPAPAISSPPPQTALVEAQRAPRAASPSASPRRPGAHSGSDLAAEVTALDGIRTALAIGAWPAAELKLASYRQNFAQGALRSEADVLALEVLVAQGRKQAAAAAAERFIQQHPRDPQVARVRALVE